MKRTAWIGLALALAAGSLAPDLDADTDERLRRNVELVIDTSGSMNDRNKIGDAKRALAKFLANVPDDTNIGLIVFDSGRPKRVLPLAKFDRAKVSMVVESLQAAGGTPINDSVVMALQSLQEQRERQGGYGTYTVVVVTDGEETGNKAALPDTVRAVVAAGVGLDVIGFGLPSGHSLKAMVTTYRSADDEAQLTQAILASVAETESYADVASFVKEEESAPRTTPRAVANEPGGEAPVTADAGPPAAVVGGGIALVVIVVFAIMMRAATKGPAKKG